MLITAFKQPKLGEELEHRLKQPDRYIEVLPRFLSRCEYLNHVRRALTTVFLPNEVEGFYPPPLEGMALGTLVVCPDCVRNCSFCLPSYNAFRPNYTLEELVRAARTPGGVSKRTACFGSSRLSSTCYRTSISCGKVTALPAV